MVLVFFSRVRTSTLLVCIWSLVKSTTALPQQPLRAALDALQLFSQHELSLVLGHLLLDAACHSKSQPLPDPPARSRGWFHELADSRPGLNLVGNLLLQLGNFQLFLQEFQGKPLENCRFCLRMFRRIHLICPVSPRNVTNKKTCQQIGESIL